MIDWKRIDALREDVGEEDFADVVEIFIDEVTEMIDKLRSAPARATLGDDLHALKGSALNLGFTDFAQLCQQGETQAANGQTNEISLAPILDCYDLSKQAFLSGLETNKAA